MTFDKARGLFHNLWLHGVTKTNEGIHTKAQTIYTCNSFVAYHKSVPSGSEDILC